MTAARRESLPVMAGTVQIGGGAPISIQSMATIDTKNLPALGEQISELTAAGCEMVRVALYDKECAMLVPRLREICSVPLIGDVHFDADIAVTAVENGIDKVRINPGNIGGQDAVKRVADAARAHGTPIRVGANSGSLPHDLRGGDGAQALAEAALREVKTLEDLHFDRIVVSIKSSSVPDSVDAARIVASNVPYPLHLGVTEAGTLEHAMIKSAVGVGTLLMEGIGDTIRVSVSGDPVQEISVARQILEASGVRRAGVEIISCPTCARCGLDVASLARKVETIASRRARPVTVAVMGCVVNGPGEAKRAHLGIAGAPGGIALFEQGKVTGRVKSEAEALDWLERALQRV